MSVKDGKNAEQVATARREEAKRVERMQWAQLYHIYERCVGIAAKVWDTKLDAAQATQRALAEEMRDRDVPHATMDDDGKIHLTDAQIPVPLFTPRDRLQFIKEVAAGLSIDARYRGLTVQFPREDVTDAAATPAGGEAAAPEAGSGVDEMLDTEARELAEAGDPGPPSALTGA